MKRIAWADSGLGKAVARRLRTHAVCVAATLALGLSLSQAPRAAAEAPLQIVSEPPAAIERVTTDALTLEVVVEGGKRPLRFSWFREEEDKSGKHLVPVDVHTPRLHFESLELDDTGVYYCEVTDGESTVLSQGTDLHVVMGLGMAWAGWVLALGIVLLGARGRRNARDGGADQEVV